MSFNGSDPARKTAPRGLSLIEKYATASAADFIREARRQGVRFASPPPAHLLRQPKPPPTGSGSVTAGTPAQTEESSMSIDIPEEQRDRLQELLQQHVSVGDAAARVQVSAGQAMKVRDSLRSADVRCNCGKQLGHTGRCSGKQGARQAKAKGKGKARRQASAKGGDAIATTPPHDVIQQVQRAVDVWSVELERLLRELDAHIEKAPVRMTVEVRVES